MQAFPDWLRERLDERRWTSADLARVSGVGHSIIWRWQADPPRRPTPANLAKIAPALGVPYEDLMKMCGYLPGRVSNHRTDPDLAKVQARWPHLSAGLKEAILRLTTASRVRRLAA